MRHPIPENLVNNIKPLERNVALAERVYDTLREQLRRGAVKPGQPLQEEQFAGMLGVSRTPVREAMARLATEGLLSNERRSFTVPHLSRQDIEDIYELRLLMEPAALRRIAPLTTERRNRRAIEEALADAAAAHRAKDVEAFCEANIRWRAAWLELVPNARLVRMIELYADHMQHIRTITLDSERVRNIVLTGLRRMTQALARGDGEQAAAATTEHLMRAREEFLRALGLSDADDADTPRAGSDT
jgi:DNA-binding GntR family transcriptional regulator